MPVLDKERRSDQLVARVRGTDKLLFQRAAALEGRSVATFVITHAREVARRVVGEQETIKLNAAQSRRLVKALLAPAPAPTARLKRAVASYHRRVAN